MSDANTDNPNRPDGDNLVADPFAAELDAPPIVRSGRRLLFTTAAAGWWLSFGFHVLSYALAIPIFAWLSLRMISEPPEIVIPHIHGSLEDETRVDDLPALQIIPAAGPDAEDATQSLQQLASQLAVSDRGQIDTVVADAKIAAIGSEESEAGDRGASPFFRIPESGLAVTKGSFTAWTDPASPDPGQSYQIIIEIRLPVKTVKYSVSDLSGDVRGTDGYRRRLPFDSRSPESARVTGGAEFETVRRNTRLRIAGKKLQLAIKVPGAGRLIRDRIRIKSTRLKEEHEITLVFGGSNGQLGLKIED